MVEGIKYIIQILLEKSIFKGDLTSGLHSKANPIKIDDGQAKQLKSGYDSCREFVG